MQDNTTTKRLLSIGEASEYLGVSIDTLRRWEKKERINPMRSPGGHRYFVKDDLDSLFGKRYTRDEETIRRESDKLSIPTEVQSFVMDTPKPEITAEIPEPQKEVAIPNLGLPLNSDYQEKNEPAVLIENIPSQKNQESVETAAHQVSYTEPVVPNLQDSIGKTSSTVSNSILHPIDTSPDENKLTDEEIEMRVNSILKSDGGNKKSKVDYILGILSSLMLLIDIALLYIWVMSARIVSPIP